MKKVVLAEKPSMKRKYQSAIKNVDVVASVGHIEKLRHLSYYLKNKINKKKNKIYWKDLLEYLPFVPDKFSYKIKNRKVFNRIKKKLKNADEIILACDPDREGELIHRNILNIAENKGYVNTNNITRVWLNSETKKGINKAYKNRKNYKNYDDLYKSAKIRELIDWLIGVELTVLYSVKFSKRKTISIGRVQSWLLSEIVKRYKENKNFTPKTYWTFNFLTSGTDSELKFNMVSKNKKGKYVTYKIFDEEKKNKILKNISDKKLHVDKIYKKKFIKRPKKLYDLKDLQKDASKKYNFSPKQTLNIAQSLYEKHELISYPRTDCKNLSEEEAKNIHHSINLARKFNKYKKYINIIKDTNPDFNLHKKYIGKLKGHYGIIPNIEYDKKNIPSLNKKESKIFDLIVKRFLKIFMKPARGMKTTIYGNIESYKFRTSFKNYNELGYLKHFSSKNNNTVSVNINEKELLKGKVEINKNKTKPPKLYNNNRILKLMEKAHLKVKDKQLKKSLKESNGIGTASTRADFIPKLISRDYIYTSKGKFIPTELGIKLVNILPDKLKRADFSAKLEYELNELAYNENFNKSIDDFIDETEKFLKENFKRVNNINSNAIKKVVEKENKVGNCPVCNNPVINKKKGYFCSNNDCDFVIWNSYSKSRTTKKNIKDLLNKGETSYKTMRSKKGNKFKAKLVLKDNGDIEYKFPKKKKKKTELTCPNCKSKIKKSKKAYYCSNNECNFYILTKYSKANITKSDMKKLISGKVTSKKKMKSKKGNTFKAKLKYDFTKNKIEYIFEN